MSWTAKSTLRPPAVPDLSHSEPEDGNSSSPSTLASLSDAEPSSREASSMERPTSTLASSLHPPLDDAVASKPKPEAIRASSQHSSKRLGLDAPEVSLRQAAKYAALAPLPTDSFSQMELDGRPSMMPRTTSSVTARPHNDGADVKSPSSSSAATPAAVTSSNPMDKVDVVQQMKKEAERATNADQGHALDFSSSPSRSPCLSIGSTGEVLPEAARAAGVASPDSWRSLLPETDPYYASETVLASGSGSGSDPEHRRPPSFSDLEGAPRPSFGRGPSAESANSTSGYSSHCGWSTSSRRLSGSSAASVHSTSSGPASGSLGANARSAGASLVPTASDSWRSLLPNQSAVDADDECEVTGARSLGTGTIRRSHGTIRGPMAGLISENTGAKRHASFSNFDRLNASSIPMEARGHSDHGHGQPAQQGQRSSEVTSSATGQRAQARNPTDSAGFASAMTASPPRSTCKAAMDDAEERESWPTSRGSRDFKFLQRATGSFSDGGSSFQESRLMSPPYTPGTSVTSPTAGSAVATTTVAAPTVVTSPVGAMGPSLVTTTTTTLTTTTTTHILPSEGTAHGTAGSEVSDIRPLPPAAPSLPTSEVMPPPPPTSASPTTSPNTTGRQLIGAPADAREPSVSIESSMTRYTVFVQLANFSIGDISLNCTADYSLRIVARNTERQWSKEVAFSRSDADLGGIAGGQRLAGAGRSTGVRAEFDGTWLVIKIPRLMQ